MTLEKLEMGAMSNLAMIEERTPERVREILKLTASMFSKSIGPISEDVLEAMAKRIESRLFIKMKDAATVQEIFAEWLPQRRAEFDTYYYSRYRSYLSSRGFPPEVLGVLDKDTDKLVGLLQDPSRLGSWKRRGLVVGHVQSGKTANYTGVICKASDYGYRFIVVLTGIQEDLRAQTQERIEEGFTGVTSEAALPKDSMIGVGKLGLEHRPWCLTSRDSDFRTSQVSLNAPLQSLKEPLILVMKKNAKILSNLIEWLRTKSQEGDGRIGGVPMLLIDDEADNASINVAAEGKSASTINSRIRELLDLFERNVYLGYTATPFANIFIDPDNSDDWEREDLFPRDFIVSLEAPTNYVGASRIFPEEADLHYTLVSVGDHTPFLPEKHKITHTPKGLPPSLIEAIHVFVLARAVRIHRGDGTKHSSMLVNVSRFNDVQTKVTGLISDQLTSLRLACMGHAALPEREAMNDPTIAALRSAWASHFEGRGPESWRDIQSLLPKAVGPVEPRKINSKSPDALDYRRYRDTGLHVIAVGGFSLSRGFTLEGLVVTYFLRNSLMYDTLLQMGRWFGYRDGYEDLCRIYMTQDAIGWYGHISEAIDELREEFKRMERARRTPVEFGLKVRSHPQALIVTARNKMRSGKKVRHTVVIGGRLIETFALRSDALDQNKRHLIRFVESLCADATPVSTPQGHLWSGIDANNVVDFIAGFTNHDDACTNTQSEPVNNYIRSGIKDKLGKWDVCLFGLQKGVSTPEPIGPIMLWPQGRSAKFHEERAGAGRFMINAEKMRVASRGHEKAGLSDPDIKRAEDEFRKEEPDAKNVPDRAYRNKRARPLLMLHVLTLNLQDDQTEHSPRQTVVAWGASFPKAKDDEVGVEYVVNTTWWSENYESDLEEAEEEVAVNA
jgi:hypothetical protein